MLGDEEVDLTRDCAAAMVPWGSPVTLGKGDHATITQQRGGSFTVVVDGNMYRIDGKDADALGKEPPELPAVVPAGDATRESVEQSAWEQLATCYDPEIPIDIVQLGLVYECTVSEAAEGKGFRVDVKMTLTAPGCGMGDYLAQEVRDKLKLIPGVAEADVQMVWDPPWGQDRMSEAARLEAGLY